MTKFLFSAFLFFAIIFEVLAESNITDYPDDGQVPKPTVKKNPIDNNPTVTSTAISSSEKSVTETLGDKVEKSFATIKNAFVQIGNFISNLFSDNTPKTEVLTETKNKALIAENTTLKLETSEPTTALQTTVTVTPSSLIQDDNTTIKA